MRFPVTTYYILKVKKQHNQHTKRGIVIRNYTFLLFEIPTKNGMPGKSSVHNRKI